MAGSGGLNDLVRRLTGGLPDGELVVALSGGPDSSFVAWVAAQRPAGGVEAVFVDHGWEHSAVMLDAARAVAGALAMPLHVVAVPPTSSETAAREERLAALAAHAGDRPVLTGHHAGDDAETVIVNLIRGAGSTGLSGIPGSRPPFLRPLLGVDPAEINAAVAELGLPCAEDPANIDPAHTRNRIRAEVVPLLDDISPGAAAAITRAAAHLTDDDRVLEAAVVDVPLTLDCGAVLIPHGVLRALPSALAARLVRRALRTVRPPYAGDARDVAQVTRVRRGVTLQLGGGLRCERDGPFVAVYDPAAVPAAPAPMSLDAPGEIDFGRHRIVAEWTARPVTHRSRRIADLAAGRPARIEIRTTEAGERIDIGTGTRPVRDLLADEAVGVRLRDGWPVAVVHGKIAWLVGVRVAAWARPVDPADGGRPATTTTLRLTHITQRSPG